MSREPAAFKALEARMGYIFKDRTLFKTALTHSSYGDGRRERADNERLEFLGDRVLGLLTAQKLYGHSGQTEGSMARRLNALVRKETCARIARDLNVSEALLLSKSEEKQGGREKTSILGDACEALLAAIYLDGGLSAASAFFDAHWQAKINSVLGQVGIDPKTALQEKAARLGTKPPVYTLESRRGPDHRPEFVINVNVDTIGDAEGTGTSKKSAERMAAAALLKQWENQV